MTNRILFIHHGGIAGGAPLSMLYTMKGARAAGYEPLAALIRPSEELHRLYNDEGFKTIETPWIPVFITWSGSEGKRWNPMMWKSVFLAWKKWKNAQTKLLSLLDEESIDLVHLNSVGLSNPASALMKVKFPFVWHVREHGPKHQGRRFKFISRRLAEAPQVIFLSKAEQSSWLGGNSHGTVVHNFIDFSQFDSSRSGDDFKEKCRIPKNHKVILYVGGKKRHKGIIELLYSLTQLKREWGADFTCLMPDTFLNRSEPLTRIEKQIDALIRAGGLEDNCRLMPFNPDIVDMFACCDVLVFPATKPHFARPVIEASAMSKPVIASDLRAVDELVLDGETGFLVPSENIEILTQRLIEILSDNKLAERLGHAGKVFALREFEFHSQVRKILRCYEHALRKE